MQAAKSLQGAMDRMLNKHTPTFLTFSADGRSIECTLECDTNYSPPVALFVDDADCD